MSTWPEYINKWEFCNQQEKQAEMFIKWRREAAETLTEKCKYIHKCKKGKGCFREPF